MFLLSYFLSFSRYVLSVILPIFQYRDVWGVFFLSYFLSFFVPDAAPRLISPQKNDVSDHQFKSVQFQVSPETERPKESQNVRPDNRSVWKTKPFSSVSFKLPETPEELFRAHDVSEEPSDLLDELYQRVKRVDDLCGKEHAKVIISSINSCLLVNGKSR